MSINFNQAQLEAVKHVHGPMMVLAGPGSGKTTVITGRLENLILNEKIPAQNILVVTFSKKAAGEMEERFLKRNLNLNEKPVFGTFHSIFYSIIRAHSQSPLKVISEGQKVRAVRAAIETLNYDFETGEDFFSAVTGEISKVKGNVLDINGYCPQCLPPEIFRYIYQKYAEFLRLSGLVDFDDMLLECLKLLAERPDVLSCWQEKYQFILTDEFQDINLLQYETLKLLAGKNRNLFIVGDDDQSIYGFRGAHPELMKRFLKDYKDAGRILLDINYRSTRQIVSAAGRVIRENENRFPKNIRPLEGRAQGQPAALRSFCDIKEEADEIIRQIFYVHKRGLPLSEIAVLFRNNADMEYLAERFSGCGLEFSAKIKVQGLYGHFIGKDITAYIRAAFMYPKCSLSDILLIMNRPSRYISRRALCPGEEPFSSMKDFYKGNRRMCAQIESFEKDLKLIKTLPPYAAVKYISSAAGYEDFLKGYAAEKGGNFSEYADILSRIQKEAEGFESLRQWLEYVKRTAAPDTAGAKEGSGKGKGAALKNKDAVSLMTIHASKGLEWEAVFIPSCIDSIIPGRNSAVPSSLEEERRILYVAMTRAKTFLQISCVKEYKGRKAQPSRFLEVLLK